MHIYIIDIIDISIYNRYKQKESTIPVKTSQEQYKYQILIKGFF